MFLIKTKSTREGLLMMLSSPWQTFWRYVFALLLLTVFIASFHDTKEVMKLMYIILYILAVIYLIQNKIAFWWTKESKKVILKYAFLWIFQNILGSSYIYEGKYYNWVLYCYSYRYSVKSDSRVSILSKNFKQQQLSL